MTGQTISHYKILEKIGEGGMGLVYKAVDTKLDREVALKFLPNRLLGDEDVRKRFEREAKASAALSHANVCHVYEIDKAEDKTFISMELIEGESLYKTIEQGPLRLEQVLNIAQQIAAGLEAAHKKGVVHRDIKPENIIIGDGGHATIMDFGLAQLTQASRLTKANQTMGTVFYMSPEQTEGADTDHRTDIWSLGVVIYEMVTGQHPFKGDYDKAVMYSILNEESEPMTALRTAVPMELERITGKCLAKDAAARYQHADELLVDLKALRRGLESGHSKTRAVPFASATIPPASILDTSIPAAEPRPGAAPKRMAEPSRELIAWAITAALAIALAALSSIHFTETLEPQSTRKFTISTPGFGGAEGRPAISPDGRYIAYASGATQSDLYLHDLAEGNNHTLPNTIGGRRPFWSPDSKSLGFIQETKIKRYDVDSDSVVTLYALPSEAPLFIASWSPDGSSIAFRGSALGSIHQVSAAGGVPIPVVTPEREDDGLLGNPYFLPDASNRNRLIYSAGSPGVGRLLVQELDSAEIISLDIVASSPIYSPTGHLLYLDSSNTWVGTLWAVPFDLEATKITGTPFIVAENVGWPSIDTRGTLVYRQDPGGRSVQIVWKNRAGEDTDRLEKSWFDIAQLRLSAPGSPRRLAFAPRIRGDGGRDVFVHDFDSGVETQATFNRSGENNWRPVWAPDGSALAFTSSARRGGFPILLKTVGASEDPTVLLSDGRRNFLCDWSSDGRHLVYYTYTVGETEDRDIWRLELDAMGRAKEPQVVVDTTGQERDAAFSPNGDWLAYAADRTGSSEVYVRKFPEGELEYKVSLDGGNQPLWGPDGDELFYVDVDTLVAVSVSFRDTLSFGDHERLFSDTSLIRTTPPQQTYDVGWDGDRFILAVPYEDPERPPVIRVVQNWYEEFRDRDQD